MITDVIVAINDLIRCYYKTSTDWADRARTEVESSGNDEAIKLFAWAVL